LKEGGLVTVSAHLYNPANPKVRLARQRVDITSLLVTNNETHTRWLGELDQIATGLGVLKQAGVVVLWRPFHEMNGDGSGGARRIPTRRQGLASHV